MIAFDKSRVSLVTTSKGDRGPVLARLLLHAPWMLDYQWVVSGSKELEPYVKRHPRSIFVPADVVIGTGRNLCAEAATGEILIHIDDDDWQSPDRIEKQVTALLVHPQGQAQPAQLVGTSWMYCLVAEKRVAHRVSFWSTNYLLAGCTMAYFRSAWQSHPFPDQMSEDGAFSQFFFGQKTAYDMRDPKLLVYLRTHGRATHHRADWWQETRHRTHTRSALEVMQDRIKNPNQPFRFIETPTEREAALAHEEEAATVYVKYLMGQEHFELFCRPPSDFA